MRILLEYPAVANDARTGLYLLIQVVAFMWKRLQVAICFAVLLMIAGTVRAVPTDRFAVLSQAEAKHMTFCSRPGPKVTGTWDPSVQDVLDLESKIGEIARLRAHQNPGGQQIVHPEAFFRQYLGVVVGGRNLIYINAFPSGIADHDWRRKFMSACDGGSSFWGALYDSNTKTFSDLEVNGVA